LLLAQGQLEARERLLEARQRTLRGQQRQVDQGVIARAEMLPSQTQLALTEADLVTLSNTVILSENNLRNLLGEDLRSVSPEPLRLSERLRSTPEIFDLRESWERALARRPDLAQLREDMTKAELGVKYRRNQLFPSLDVVAGYGRRGASTAQVPPPFEAEASASDAFEQLADGTAPTEFLGFIFSLPLSRASERASYRASKELRAQAELMVKQREELILREVADAVATARASLEGVRAARRATEYARAAAEAEERKLAGGTSTIFFVLQLQADVAAARSSEVVALAAYSKALSTLRFAEGRILDEYGLTIALE
jgi:outer membrane protein TolC